MPAVGTSSKRNRELRNIISRFFNSYLDMAKMSDNSIPQNSLVVKSSSSLYSPLCRKQRRFRVCALFQFLRSQSETIYNGLLQIHDVNFPIINRFEEENWT